MNPTGALATASLDERISAAIQPFSDAIAGFIFFSVPVAGTTFPLIVGWLILAATVFTFYFRFIQIRGFRHAIDVVRGRYSDKTKPGEVSPFQALTAAVSGTVGLGNIAGVAVAVAIGGAGATFWMILAGLLGMASKFTEVTLGVKYRDIKQPAGTVAGGPMRYLSKGLAEQGRPRLGKFLAVFFAICCIGGSIGGGNMFQANQSFQQVLGVTGGVDSPLAGNAWVFGLVMAVLVGLVIIGGIRSIATVTSKLVPTMALIYVGAGLIVLAVHADQILWAFGQIFAGAFSAEGVTGGVVGALIQGFRRATFSNEAGIGSAAIAHSAVRTDQPVSQGFAALLEPFIDTVVICTMTALVIIITGHVNMGGVTELAGEARGVALTSVAFGSAIAWFPYVLALCVVLFAFSTMITWSYYGLQAWIYLLGDSMVSTMAYKFMFLTFVVIGTTMGLGPVIDFSDSMIFAMSLANIVGLYMLMPVVRTELLRYEHGLRSGEIRMVAA
ncbi:MAG: alanine/glycine:cation symporter family protein [Hydrogenophaga sp.]|jgi:AGCS family alanine or glycine:cation symporter|uniref:alanine/glycine:cation symporter family protein n=1 Tax=Hydrogenophaga sp. TaxID=1904254 RepID=UPI0025BA4ABC|nr:alanine/glycine:cation symporter family protein [Hydrogenophaga sp.]MDO9507685.1 alanine/glycine:cation symporter family protein [Hydrogenophaga sp.]MDP2987875.1 alanine/glycine:cation symporter family protein [Hydrogenophaga sp.]MDP3206123.1 alanine/glycine:cation symporter family protein [Hydrogenophaga sp.]MDP3628302.1 alanine/glycine:cation symporter family protein [Hydrogenophaga sp.]